MTTYVCVTYHDTFQPRTGRSTWQCQLSTYRRTLAAANELLTYRSTLSHSPKIISNRSPKKSYRQLRDVRSIAKHLPAGAHTALHRGLKRPNSEYPPTLAWTNSWPVGTVLGTVSTTRRRAGGASRGDTS